MSCRILMLVLCIQPLVWGSTKKGVVLWWEDLYCDDFALLLNKTAWWYDWKCNPHHYYQDNRCTSLIDQYKNRYVPMVWGFNRRTDYSCYMGTETGVVLGPNEPNHAKQSNLTPKQAADLWPSLENHAGDKIIVSPSASNCNKSDCHGNTIEWFDAFFGNCSNCRVDKLATHTYWCGAEKTINYLEYLYNRYGKPIWLTEFTCRHKNNDPERVLQFMKEVLPLLEAAPFVERYFWYKLRIVDDSKWVQTSSSLFYPNTSELTPAGEYYAAYTYTPE